MENNYLNGRGLLISPKRNRPWSKISLLLEYNFDITALFLNIIILVLNMLKYMLPKKAGLMVFTDKIIFSKNLKIREETAVELEFIRLK